MENFYCKICRDSSINTNIVLINQTTMSGRSVAPSVANKVDSIGHMIQGRDRDYGNVLWKQPNLLDLSYAELEEKNLEVKQLRLKGAKSEEVKDRFIKYLESDC